MKALTDAIVFLSCNTNRFLVVSCAMNGSDAARLLGSKGGKAKSKAKAAAVRKNLEAARAKRWPDKRKKNSRP